MKTLRELAREMAHISTVGCGGLNEANNHIAICSLFTDALLSFGVEVLDRVNFKTLDDTEVEDNLNDLRLGLTEKGK
jgi:hypothetical protein